MVWRKRILKLFVLLVVMAVIFQLLTFLLMKNLLSAEIHIKGFYREPENTLDVAFVGCSELYADYSPPLAYEESGFTSYNLCFSGASGSLYPSMIGEFYKSQKPQLLVLEVNGFFYDEKHSKNEPEIRKWVDNMERSPEWAKYIKENVEPHDRLSYYLPICKYHGSWEYPYDIATRMFCLGCGYCFQDVSMMKSFGTHTSTNSATKVMRKNDEQHMPEYGKQTLAETIDYCHECGIENVLFIRTPHKTPLDKKTDKEFADIITEGGYDYVNFEQLTQEIGIDDSVDYYNIDHMNVFGCEKFTRYLSRYITEHYNIDTSHSSETDAQWNKCVMFTHDVFDVLQKRTLDEEDIFYNEYTDVSPLLHQHLVREERKDAEKTDHGKKKEFK